jgi:hypothetical protein
VDGLPRDEDERMLGFEQALEAQNEDRINGHLHA